MVKKILVVRYRFIGDTVLTVPFLRNLRYANADAQIDMIVAPNSGEVIENCPYVNNFIFFDTTRKHKYECSQGQKHSFWEYVKQLRKEKYDKAYILKRSFSSALLCFLANIKERIGFDTEGRGFLLTKKVKYEINKHESECFLDVLKADNIEIKNRYLENWITDETQDKVLNLFAQKGISQNDKKVIVHATATNDGKLWDLSNYREIIKYLIADKNCKIIHIGAKTDSLTYDKIYKDLDIDDNKVVNFCGQLSIQESLAVIKNSDLIIGNDSGNLHMAASAGTRVVGIYGPMNINKWYAIGDKNIILKSDLPCMPCGLKKKCKFDKKCLKNITPDMVKNILDKIL